MIANNHIFNPMGVPMAHSLVDGLTMPTVTPQTIEEAIDRDTLFRVAYIPYVIFEVAWDYVDTTINLAILLRIQETKRLTRAMRELRRRFDQQRQPFIDRNDQEKEQDHMIEFEEKSNHVLTPIYKGLKTTIRKQHPALVGDWVDFLCSVELASIIFSALFKYGIECDKLIESRCGRANHSILPDEMFKIANLVKEFRGDTITNIRLRPAYVGKMLKQIKRIDLIEER